MLAVRPAVVAGAKEVAMSEQKDKKTFERPKDAAKAELKDEELDKVSGGAGVREDFRTRGGHRMDPDGGGSSVTIK
jgi:hypothetical protein